MGGTTRVIQVTNVAPGATLDQMKTLFGFLGDIEDIKLFPGEDSIVPVTSRVCFVKYEDPTSVGVAQHLTNTVFIDRALIVVPCGDGIIPDEHKALAIAAPANAVAGLMPTPSGGGLLPTPATGILGQVGGLLPTPAPGILGQVPSLVGLAGAAQITAPFDSTLAALGLPQPPPLPGNVDPSKIEEIRRTIYVGNLDSQTVTAEQLLNFFSQVGEVKYVRMAGDETQPTRFAFVEFSDQKSVAAALTYNGVMFGGRPLKINHSNNAIVKPQTKTPEAAAREMEEAMKRVRDAQALIQAAIDPEFKDNDTDVKKKKSRSRSRSRDRHKRSRSRSRSKRRSRSRSRRRSRSRGRYSRSPKRRSHSPRRRRSRSRSRGRDRRRSRSRSRDHKRSRTPPRGYRGRYTRSRSSPSGATGNSNKTGERRRRSRSPRSRRSRSRTRRSPKRRSRSSSDSPKRSKRKKKDKDRDRERDRERDRSRERERSKKHKRDKDRDREHRESKSKEVKVTRDYDEEEKGYDSDKERDSSSSSKEQQNDDRDIKDERDYSPKENTEQMDMDLSD